MNTKPTPEPDESDASAIPLLLRRIVNRAGRPLGIHPFPRAFPPVSESADRQRAFDTIYRANHWGSAQSASGIGSERAFTRRYRLELQRLITQRGFTSLFDAPCGDLNWMPLLLKEVSLAYRGGDISQSLVADLHGRYPDLALSQFDICQDPFPQADVWHCRDCLFHLPLADIHAALSNFAASEIPYALLTTHRARWLHRNLDVTAGGFRYLDLERPPLSLPPPEVRLPDYRVGREFPRYVGLWRREQIAQALKTESASPLPKAAA